MRSARGDVLTCRKGLTVEINNTDAEGRLVLADALALADEETPDLMVSMATLTGAARVAVGPDLAPFYTDRRRAGRGAAGGRRARSPTRSGEMPFWAPYEAMIEPGIADLDNAPSGGMAGSITAALFLRRFVTDSAALRAFRHLRLAARRRPGAAEGRRRPGRAGAARGAAGGAGAVSDPPR